MDISIEKFLNGMTRQEFLENYWQKKPYVFKAAVSGIDEVSDSSALIDMGLDENFHTRMVLESGGEYPWQAMEGPFDDSQLDPANNKKWTLIVHNLEKYFSEFRQLRNLVDFVPSWLFDDIMSTYSMDGASVGAHIDNYNVFIVQGSGKRRWMINENPDETYIEDLDIKLLKNFEVENEYILEPGDMLYLPPGVAHHGVSIGESVSFSIGFRAFDYEDMMGSFFSEMMGKYQSSKSLQVSDKSIPVNINEFTESHLDDVQSFFMNEILNRENMKDWFGKYITVTQHNMENEWDDDCETLKMRLKSGESFYNDEFNRFNYKRLEGDQIGFYVNGANFILGYSEYLELEKMLQKPNDEAIFLDISEKSPVFEVILQLLQMGAFYFED